MKQKSLNSLIIRLRICILAFILVGLSLFLLSFTVKKISDDYSWKKQKKQKISIITQR